MKWITIMIMVVLLSSITLGAVQPQETDPVLLTKISDEHRNTRQFITTMVETKQDEFFAQFMKKGDEYQATFNDMIDSAVIKLGFMWGGILMFFLALDQTLKLRLEKKRYNVLKEAIKADLIKEIVITQKTPQAEPQKPVEPEFISKFKKW